VVVDVDVYEMLLVLEDAVVWPAADEAVGELETAETVPALTQLLVIALKLPVAATSERLM
jgi:hypothetical protein